MRPSLCTYITHIAKEASLHYHFIVNTYGNQQYTGGIIKTKAFVNCFSPSLREVTSYRSASNCGLLRLKANPSDSVNVLVE